MTSIVDTLLLFFKDKSWEYKQLGKDNTFEILYQGKNGNWICYLKVRESQDQIVFYSILPLNVPELKKTDVLILLTRLNYGLVIGNFEMDIDDGEIRFKTSMDTNPDYITSELIKSLIEKNVFIVDRYLPSIEAVVYLNNKLDEIVDMNRKADNRKST
jgi:hypothetical protein